MPLVAPLPETLVSEPGKITFKGATFFSKGNIEVIYEPEFYTVDSSIAGPLDDSRLVDAVYRIRFTPVGEFEAMSVLLGAFLAGGPKLGQSLMGGNADVPCVITTESDNVWTFKNAGVTGATPILLGVKQTLWGPWEITAIIKRGGNPAARSSYYTLANTSGAYGDNSALSPGTIYTDPYTADYTNGTEGDGITGMATQEGWVITPQIKVERRWSDGFGTVDLQLDSISVSATCKPSGVLLDTLLGLAHPDISHGASRLSEGRDLNIYSDNVYVRMYNATLKSGGGVFGRSLQNGAFTWSALRGVSAGAVQPLLYLGASAPV